MPRRKKPTTQENEPLRLPLENPKAKMWLWIGVSVISAIILVMWGWATSIRLSSFSWDKTPEKKLVEKSQNDWNILFNNEQSRIKNEQMKKQIKNLINELSAQINTTTNATSTTNTSSTAEIIITNTTTINTTTP